MLYPDAGNYRCVVTGLNGDVVITQPVTLQIDANQSTGPPQPAMRKFPRAMTTPCSSTKMELYGEQDLSSRWVFRTPTPTPHYNTRQNC